MGGRPGASERGRSEGGGEAQGVFDPSTRPSSIETGLFAVLTRPLAVHQPSMTRPGGGERREGSGEKGAERRERGAGSGGREGRRVGRGGRRSASHRGRTLQGASTKFRGSLRQSCCRGGTSS